jgi:hypothetical protein
MATRHLDYLYLPEKTLNANPYQWREQQLNSFANLAGADIILTQEKIMLDFVTQHKIVWKWHADDTKFRQLCKQFIDIGDNDCQGVIVFGVPLYELTTSQLVQKIQTLTQNFDCAYIAINRYKVIAHDLDFELPDLIEDSLDLIMSHCHPGFRRLHTFHNVDGNHMIAVHPMDCYGLCKS